MVSGEIEEHVATEAFGWLNSAMFVGGAIGTALAGVATEAHGFMGAVVVAATLAILTAVSPLIARMTGPLHGLYDDPEAPAEVDNLCTVQS
jgi:predicted MFS family arabinose efflux permease